MKLASMINLVLFPKIYFRDVGAQPMSLFLGGRPLLALTHDAGPELQGNNLSRSSVLVSWTQVEVQQSIDLELSTKLT